MNFLKSLLAVNRLSRKLNTLYKMLIAMTYRIDELEKQLEQEELEE